MHAEQSLLSIKMSATPQVSKSVQTSSLRSKKIWYADDGGGGGSLDQLLTWWQDVQKSEPLFGYFPKASKTWLIVKPGKLES